MDGDIAERLEAIFRQSFEIERFTEDLSIDNVTGWDSMGHVGLILALQKEFAVSIPPADALGLTSAGNIIKYLANNEFSSNLLSLKPALTADVPAARDIRIVTLLPEHAEQVAKLHILGIATGFISSLGMDFVKTLYCAIAESKYSVCMVAVQDKKVLGFAAFTTNINDMYRSIIFKRGLKLSLMLFRKMLSVNMAKNIFETLLYPERIKKKMNLPKAEFLSIAMSEDARGTGLAIDLVKRGFEECAKLGVKELKTFTSVNIKAANTLYKKLGFRLVGQMKNHGVVSNVYIARTDHFDHNLQKSYRTARGSK